MWITGWSTYGQAVDGILPRMTARGSARDEMQLAQFLRSRNIHAARPITGLPIG
jgi:hypothetical protein